MRKFENRETEITKTIDEEGNKEFMTYADLISACMDVMPKDGWLASEMKKRLDLEAYLKEFTAGESIEIEEHQYETIKSCVVGFKWAMKHMEIFDFEATIKDLKEIKKTKKK